MEPGKKKIGKVFTLFGKWKRDLFRVKHTTVNENAYIWLWAIVDNILSKPFLDTADNFKYSIRDETIN